MRISLTHLAPAKVVGTIKASGWTNPFRAKRKYLQRLQEVLPEDQGQNLALNVLYRSTAFDCAPHLAPKKVVVLAKVVGKNDLTHLEPAKAVGTMKASGWTMPPCAIRIRCFGTVPCSSRT